MPSAAMSGRRDLVGVLAVLLATGVLLAYRAWGIEPREWASLCAGAAPPAACGPRAALLWLQHYYVWGAAALVLGLLAFVGRARWLQPLAVAAGVAAVINYNATWGMVGAVLGAWAWVTVPRPAI